MPFCRDHIYPHLEDMLGNPGVTLWSAWKKTCINGGLREHGTYFFLVS